jgi:hypothetical protein
MNSSSALSGAGGDAGAEMHRRPVRDCRRGWRHLLNQESQHEMGVKTVLDRRETGPVGCDLSDPAAYQRAAGLSERRVAKAMRQVNR